jgi:hypothetical protein
MSGYWSTNFLALNPPVKQIFDLSGYMYQSQAQIYDLRNAWNTYERVQISNIKVSTSIGLGTIVLGPGTNTPYFYQFASMEEKNMFYKGENLHIGRYPYINFSTIVR